MFQYLNGTVDLSTVPFIYCKQNETARTWWKSGRFCYSSSVSVMTSSLETVRGWNSTFPVSVLMKYISFSNSFFSKLMELFIIITITFFIFLWHILLLKVFMLLYSTSSCFPHPLCTNENWAENVLYGILSCYHLYSSFPVWYGYIITCISLFVQCK